MDFHIISGRHKLQYICVLLYSHFSHQLLFSFVSSFHSPVQDALMNSENLGICMTRYQAAVCSVYNKMYNGQMFNQKRKQSFANNKRGAEPVDQTKYHNIKTPENVTHAKAAPQINSRKKLEYKLRKKELNNNKTRKNSSHILRQAGKKRTGPWAVM